MALPSGFPLPTLDRLGASIPTALDAKAVATDWFNAFTTAASAADIDALVSLFIPESFWRDILALTWNFRTFIGRDNIQNFLKARLSLSKPHTFTLRPTTLPSNNHTPTSHGSPSLGNTGTASGVARLVPQSDGTWKAQCVFTSLTELQGFPEQINERRNDKMDYGFWAAKRLKESLFEDEDPKVLIIGAGQAGLAVAARLKVLDVPALIIEKNQRVGDNWRNRYKALCLHDPICKNSRSLHPPLYPANWPVFSPADKIAGWLEYYADAMELNVWTSCEVTSATRNADSQTWTVTVRYSNGTQRVFTRIKHVVFATGFNGNQPNIPSYPGHFQRPILHSNQYKSASAFVGKKVVVVGAAVSAHDIATDLYHAGVDVTIYQRSSTYIMSAEKGLKVYFSGLYYENGPPIDVADLISASFPVAFAVHGFQQRVTELIADMDKDLLSALAKRGFRANKGIDGTGAMVLYLTKGAGYYLDTGASTLIIDGKIKLKNDTPLQGFTPQGLKFEDGSEVEADVVVYATGYGDGRTVIRNICGPTISEQCSPVWGLDEEGETRGAWRDIGVPGLWYATGNIAMARSYSKYLALQIKAMEEGVFGERYLGAGVSGGQ
ncbi:hypothetical protein BDP27DRAFT_1331715 [Rhodocollybia butyracea]|uniref:Flavin-containing monooxygenase n=1 Tax=Rhodocollybia butyracea TaxID=206335 RepID=A0A9P5PNB8_9AGAR|nr:hypothetical protein BDP27DRAFT_1331715 [Rhodocollybia butyracea]